MPRLSPERLLQRLSERQCRSPRRCGVRRCAGRLRSARSSAKPPCLPSCSSMWSKKPRPVDDPRLSRPVEIDATVIRVSRVLRSTSAVRGARQQGMRDFGPVPVAAELRRPELECSVRPGCWRMRRRSRGRRPLPSAPSRCCGRGDSAEPGQGPACAWAHCPAGSCDRSARRGSRCPGLSNTCIISPCGPVEVGSSERKPVPSPSWLVTITNSIACSRRRSIAGITPGTKRSFSKRSIWKSDGSSIKVPSRSTNRIARSCRLLSHGQCAALKHAIVLFRRADADAQRVASPAWRAGRGRRRRPPASHRRLAAHRSTHQHEIGPRWNDTTDARRPCQRRLQACTLCQ